MSDQEAEPVGDVKTIVFCSPNRAVALVIKEGTVVAATALGYIGMDEPEANLAAFSVMRWKVDTEGGADGYPEETTVRWVDKSGYRTRAGRLRKALWATPCTCSPDAMCLRCEGLEADARDPEHPQPEEETDR